MELIIIITSMRNVMWGFEQPLLPA